MRNFSKQILVLAISMTFVAACSTKSKTAEPKKEASAPQTTATAPSAPTPEASTKKITATKKAKAAKKSVETDTAATANANSTSAGTITCKSGADTRTLEVKGVNGGCELVYTKMSEAKSIATANSGNEHCTSVSDKVRNNLTTAGFTCE